MWPFKSKTCSACQYEKAKTEFKNKYPLRPYQPRPDNAFKHDCRIKPSREQTNVRFP